MENKNQAEIELKIMLESHNISLIENWLNSVKAFELLEQKSQMLGNSYYDTPEQFFASQKMGLRVRSQNHQFEITLKTKGEIVGGLHIRPEYNLSLPTKQPDFLALVEKYHLPFENAEQIANSLQTIFSTDFIRQIWLFKVGTSKIEVALDQGLIKNRYGEEAISELEFEIKQGNLSDLFNLVEAMPKVDGMWLSGLSKAQRGYLVGQAVKFEQDIAKAMRQENSYQLEQKLADFIRVGNENKAVLERFNQCVNQKLETWEDSKAFVKSQDYLMANLAILKSI
ncbi:CYTH domain-containing protein [Mannheimia varigena]|uniref:Adenylate cyclase n=1 Tax=Mannheimia varigena USDA-ARS-USMARC-1296 TaxID=1433287 RepID=W0QDN9_9PAST|nr:CYTH domain-containing protein [Mannheimia varigena]AHG75338.1 Adenylate cyclase [Mannheimia varigena USDA-ARS-USMARC-1296]AWW34520.1 CYTH domain-containing protein [Mannheimia varigena]